MLIEEVDPEWEIKEGGSEPSVWVKLYSRFVDPVSDHVWLISIIFDPLFFGKVILGSSTMLTDTSGFLKFN